MWKEEMKNPTTTGDIGAEGNVDYPNENICVNEWQDRKGC